MTQDPLSFYTFGYGGFGYDTSHVPPNEETPVITKRVEDGNLAAVQNIVQAASADSEKAKHVTLNYARRWTEVDYRLSGFTKEYEWFDLTPLATAALKGHDDIVLYLLEQGADPTLEGCPDDDVYLTALQSANQLLRSAMASSDKSKWNKPRRCVDLLSVAELFWEKASYAGSRYSKTKRLEFSNRPCDVQGLQQALREVKDIALYPGGSLKSEALKSLKARFIA